MTAIRFADFDALTFDCYGTLVDWERGILAGVRPVLQTHGIELTRRRGARDLRTP